MSSKDDERKETIPDIICDTNTKSMYQRLRFFGKGGFAKCYEIQETKTKEIYAGKIVSKSLLVKQNQREKMAQEISIHNSLKHEHVVGFHSFFEDSTNIYIVLELCKKRSMMELHKRRKAITEPETRFYMHQILQGVQYLHNKRIIHRDLKLGNLFLNDDLHVKIGDFGLAAKIEYLGEKKKTLCGTPNYIAPEILTKKGHSYEVDIWSIGCIMYTLLVGKPPFETSSLKDTYKRIKLCDYKIPDVLQPAAKQMIMAALQPEPTKRPTVGYLLNHKFFFSGVLPAALPVSCLTTAPRLEQFTACASRRPLTELNGCVKGIYAQSPITSEGKKGTHRVRDSPDYRCHLTLLKDQLKKVMETNPGKDHGNFGDDMTDPEAQPMMWIGKWVDYSDKYGFGYQLSDEGVGVMFNDTTKLILLADGSNVHYIDRVGTESYMTMKEYPKELDKKVKLLTYFRKYMSEHLMKAGASVPVESDGISRVPHLHLWFRTTLAVIMFLTNGTLQINFRDHTKIILCPLMAAVTFIDTDKSFRTFRFQNIEKYGCCQELAAHLKYAQERIDEMLIRKVKEGLIFVRVEI